MGLGRLGDRETGRLFSDLSTHHTSLVVNLITKSFNKESV
jgi:hypothetical protein